MSAPLPTASRWNTHSRSRYPGLWDGCVGAWCPSLGVSGARLHDFSGRQNWATLQNMEPDTDWIVSGGGYALDFGGVNENAQADGVLKGRTGNLAISYWANFIDTSRKGGIVAIGDSLAAPAFDGVSLGVGGSTYDNSGNNVIGLFEGVRWIGTGTAYGTGWHHAAISLNLSGHPTIYLDGRQIYTDTTGNMNAIGSTTTPYTRIGGYANPSGGGSIERWFVGPVDDVMVYGRALHPSEIRLLATRRAIAYEPETQPAYYTETDAGGGGGVASRPYAYQSARLIGAGR